MAFVNCELDENDRREYTLGWPRVGEKRKFVGGTIDFEKDIRLFNYANGPIMEPSNEYQFIFDYKGMIFDIELRQRLENGNVVHWYFNEILEEDVKDELRNAIKVYAYHGYRRPAFDTGLNEVSTVIAHF